ncbi:MAG: hypothetical protein PF518_17565 [Spirochaetaceae bacterium]|nr:hypothetical protein [Spirochaetaceae bacterium]
MLLLRLESGNDYIESDEDGETPLSKRLANEEVDYIQLIKSYKCVEIKVINDIATIESCENLNSTASTVIGFYKVKDSEMLVDIINLIYQKRKVEQNMYDLTNDEIDELRAILSNMKDYSKYSLCSFIGAIGY